MSSSSSTAKPMDVQEDLPGTRVEQCGNQILRVRGDGHSDLEALFSVLENRNDAPSVGSLKNRKLPASFFRPPEPKHPCPPPPAPGHDCAGGGGGGEGPIHHPGTVSTSAIPIHSPVISHCRSRSSPVEHSGAPPRHARQSSMDAWDMVGKCPKCQMKCWSQDLHHPSGYVPVADIAAPQHQLLNRRQHGVCPNQQPHQLADLSKRQQDLGPLPPGWEQGITPEGELYFINHIEKTTSWNDPRLMCRAHGVGPVAMCQALQSLEQQVPQFSQQPGYLSQQQQQQLQLLQQQQQQQGGLSVPSARRPLANDKFLCLQLRKLQQEKERLLQEQEAIACKEMMLNELVRHSTASGGGGGDVQMKCMSASCALNPGQGIQPPPACNPAALDPFLGQAGHATVESHVRQSSTDSGLGGMGATYNLPRSPDDYLSNVEETEGNYKVPMSHSARRGNGNTGGDITSVSEMADFFEGEHLITSLGEELESEIFNEMDVQKINNLLWL